MDAPESTSTTVGEQQAIENELAVPDGAVDLSEEQNGGIWKVVLKEGEGDAKPAKGDTCFVHYDGTLTDGTKFDSSRDRGEPFEFKLGRSQVIKGWDVAVATMKKGELCKIIVKPEFGYGALGSEPRIPPNATLIFEIELLKWEGEDISPDKDRSIFRRIIEEGDKHGMPIDGANIEADLIGWHNDREFMNGPVKFVLGEASEAGLPDGVDVAVKRFKKGERSRVQLKRRWAYGKEGSAQYDIPPDADIEFEIHLKNYENAKQSWEMNDDEKVAECEKLKERGTQFFQQGKNKLAVAKYKGVIDLLQYETGWVNEKKQKREMLMIAAQNNLAIVYLKMNETTEAIKQCDKVLELDNNNVKALYRKGQALQTQNDFEDAIQVYNSALELEPENKAAQCARIQCRTRLAEYFNMQKALYANIFQKMAQSKNADDSGKDSEHAGTGPEENGVQEKKSEMDVQEKPAHMEA